MQHSHLKISWWIFFSRKEFLILGYHLKYGEATKKYLEDVALKCALAISSETLDIASWEIVLGNAADVPE